ncbi:helicase-related protein [Halapricum desulfuricans]|uniref:Superfamily II DNA/RNA helicase, SNF2 family n=1 Tax=Halapricum desulfuricans TaxID=2841257 RepID=A0A897NF98_9EURY|nr:helicase-related protein [Halapricum desulfuricans]QSG09599.1 Superfamily II DNA/RNA helicase, SNF2 family [Halapricum desulfuricans]
MTSLRHYDWRAVYESQPSDDRSYLVEEFYRPALERATQYDRIAGYFNSGALAAAAKGIEAFIDNDAEMRLIVGAQLQERDRPILEALEDEFDERFTDLDESQLDGRLEILAWLLEHDRLKIKVAQPKHGKWGVFHPKVGIFYDSEGNRLSFEGSVNETKSGWTMNYERFKVHRDWRREEATYLTADVESFDQLWNDDHEYVDVYDLSTAIEENIIEWKSPDSFDGVEKAAKRAQGKDERPEESETGEVTASGAAAATILDKGPKMPQGLHIAEEASTIDPWPHQRVVSDTAVNTYPQGFLFCDEVGLGKTIEIGFTLSRLGLTDEIQNSLLLVPAGLTQQWQEELWEKFNLNTYRYDRTTGGDYVFYDAFGNATAPPGESELDIDAARRAEDWTESPIWRFVHDRQADSDQPVIVIMSWHTARLSRYWDDIAPGGKDNGRQRGNVPASVRGRDASEREGVWDTVVVDEAHNARRTTNLYGLLEELRPHTQTYYLMTATPMQLHHEELYDLLTLLELPDEWDNRNRFSDFFRTRRALIDALDESGSDEALTEISTQQTLDGEYQAGIDTSLSTSEEIYLKVSEALGLEDEAIARQRLLTACKLARSYGDSYDGYVETVDEAIAAADLDTFMGEDRQLKQLLYPESVVATEPFIVSRSDRRTAIDELSEDAWRVIQEVLDEATPVNALLHRNTRDTLEKYSEADILDESVADRDPERKDISLSDEAAEVYERIDEYTTKFYKKAQEAEEQQTQALGFVMTTYRERLTSSIAAIRKSLSHRLETLERQHKALERKAAVEEDIDAEAAASLAEFSTAEQVDFAELEDGGESMLGVDISEVVPGDTDEGLSLIEEEITELRSFIQDVRQIGRDPKINQLRDDLRELDKQGHDRVLVFTQYTDTLDYVRSHLTQTHGENVATYSGRGGEMYDADADEWYGVSKEQVKRAFAAEEDGVDVLVGTEAASEGLNLQECGAVINYDLPWNPMKVEQRIGRVDRIGQEHDEITIYHYIYEDTIENDIYDALDDRINMFEDVVGELQPILAGVNQNIKSATLEGDGDAAASVSEQMQATGDQDTVDVREALTEVESATREEVLANARLTAWESYSHPDIESVGAESHDNVPFTTGSVEAAFTSVFPGILDSLTVTPVAEIEEASEIDEEYREAVYRVTLPDEVEISWQLEEGTVASQIANKENTVAVTFDPACADEYPSLRFALPGEPIFDQLVDLVCSATDTDKYEWVQLGYDWTGDDYRTGGESWIIGHLFKDEAGVVLGPDGTAVETPTDMERLEEWVHLFTQNRT